MADTVNPIMLGVAPVAKPRMTRSDKWRERPRVVDYWRYADLLRLEARKFGYKLAGTVRVTFYLPMPKSWSKRKKIRYAGQPHQARPDLDNLVKAFTDALSPENDSYIWQLDASKFWAETGWIEVWPVEDI